MSERKRCRDCRFLDDEPYPGLRTKLTCQGFGEHGGLYACHQYFKPKQAKKESTK